MLSIFSFADDTPPLARMLQIEEAPRHLALAWSFKLNAGIAAVVLTLSGLIAVAMLSERSSAVSSWLFAVLAFLMALSIGVKTCTELLRHRSILKMGKSCTGMIVSQRWVRDGRRSSNEVVYEFPVGGPARMVGRGIDRTRMYRVNMSVLVFYDPEDISRNVAFCCTDWRVRNQAGQILEP